MDNEIQGKRVRNFEHLDKPSRLKKGDYGQDANGRIWVCTPNGGKGVLCFHKIDEHEDGTITTSPIASGNWYGFIDHGVWRPLERESAGG